MQKHREVVSCIVLHVIIASLLHACNDVINCHLIRDFVTKLMFQGALLLNYICSISEVLSDSMCSQLQSRSTSLTLRFSLIVLVMLLILAGDVEVNPGPQTFSMPIRIRVL